MITHLGDYGYVPNFWERNQGKIIFSVIGFMAFCLIIGLIIKWYNEQNDKQATEQKLDEVQSQLSKAQKTNQKLWTWLNNRQFGRGFNF